jgi:hypothetical protein
MRRILFGWLACLAVVAALAAFSGPAQADEEGAVAVCNWDNFTQYGHDGYNWHWMGCNYELFGRVQCRGEAIPRCWTATEAKRDARAFRAYTGNG